MVEGDSVFIVVQQVIYLNLDEYLMIFICLSIYIYMRVTLFSLFMYICMVIYI